MTPAAPPPGRGPPATTPRTPIASATIFCVSERFDSPAKLNVIDPIIAWTAAFTKSPCPAPRLLAPTPIELAVIPPVPLVAVGPPVPPPLSRHLSPALPRQYSALLHSQR